MIRVVLVDDQRVVRDSYRAIFASETDIEVVGEADNGRDAVALVARTRPDVACLDVRMPGGGGLEATRRILQAPEGAPAVLVVTTFDLDEYVFGALEAGAQGFLLKDAEPDELVAAVRHLARGSGLLDQVVAPRVFAEFARRRPAAPLDDGAVSLTRRERDILRVLATGCSNDEIARALFIEPSTVKSHLSRVMAKIGTRDRLQTVVWTHTHGWA